MQRQTTTPQSPYGGPPGVLMIRTRGQALPYDLLAAMKLAQEIADREEEVRQTACRSLLTIPDALTGLGLL
ncbi:MAG TPA: hypothetical protein VGF45_02850 [Polyangia bacterium]